VGIVGELDTHLRTARRGLPDAQTVCGRNDEKSITERVIGYARSMLGNLKSTARDLNGIKNLTNKRQRSRVATVELEATFLKNDLDILLVQEPYTRNGKMIGFGQSHLKVLQPNDPASWVAAVVKTTEIEIFQNSSIETPHFQALQVATHNSRINVFNIYCQFSLPIEQFLVDRQQGFWVTRKFLSPEIGLLRMRESGRFEMQVYYTCIRTGDSKSRWVSNFGFPPLPP
jgi:hypothetical protein